MSHKLGWTAAALTGAWLHPDLILACSVLLSGHVPR
jgi:hypothetical protein